MNMKKPMTRGRIKIDLRRLKGRVLQLEQRGIKYKFHKKKLISRMGTFFTFLWRFNSINASILEAAYIFKWDFVRWVNSKLGKLKHKTDWSTLSLFSEAFVRNTWKRFSSKKLLTFPFCSFSGSFLSISCYKQSHLRLRCFVNFCKKLSLKEKSVLFTANDHNVCHSVYNHLHLDFRTRSYLGLVSKLRKT